MNIFNDPEGLKGIQRNPNTVSALMWPTRFYIRGSGGPLTPNARLQVNKFHDKAESAINAVNSFFAEKWTVYVEKVEAIPPKLFKDFEAVKIE